MAVWVFCKSSCGESEKGMEKIRGSIHPKVPWGVCAMLVVFEIVMSQQGNNSDREFCFQLETITNSPKVCMPVFKMTRKEHLQTSTPLPTACLVCTGNMLKARGLVSHPIHTAAWRQERLLFPIKDEAVDMQRNYKWGWASHLHHTSQV